jgi:kynurenine formamidase
MQQGGIMSIVFSRLAVPAAAVAFVFASGPASAQECSPENWQACGDKPWVTGDMETPIGARWWPSELWGEGDEAGSTNWYTKPEVVLRALETVSEGKVYKLAHEYNAAMPLFGARQFVLRIPATPTGGPFGGNQIVWHDDFLATEVGQVGTQFDGLGHIGVASDPQDKSQMHFYNGFTVADIGDAYGLKHLGVEKLHPIVARGILIDFAGARGVESMVAGECASMEDVEAALERQGMADFEFQGGDGIFFRYGWESHWEDPATFVDGQPGICMDVARWISDEVQAGLTGGDNWAATDPVPYPDEPACAFCVHQHLQTRHGIVNHENLRLKQLADDEAWVFTYVFAPTPITGATGSMGSPIAIR